MKNRLHIASILLGFMILVFAASFKPQDICFEELIGKGNPELYGNGYQLRLEAHEAFLKMKADAAKAGIDIQVVSSYRSFEHQKQIWNRKYKRYKNRGLSQTETINKIIEYSTIPGTSRHHWGTDIDLIDGNATHPKYVLNPIHFEDNGAYGKLKQWMDAHSKTYGFYLVYTNKPERKGFKYEPWHYSYKPLSQQYLNSYKSLNILDLIQENHLAGHQSLDSIFIKNYVKNNILDINPELLP